MRPLTARLSALRLPSFMGIMHLTYHDSDTHLGTASAAKAAEAGAPEIEITPAMIEAGMKIFCRSMPDYGGWCADTAAEIVEEIIASALAACAGKTGRAD
jgi:hypothetical protein